MLILSVAQALRGLVAACGGMTGSAALDAARRALKAADAVEECKDVSLLKTLLEEAVRDDSQALHALLSQEEWLVSYRLGRV